MQKMIYICMATLLMVSCHSVEGDTWEAEAAAYDEQMQDYLVAEAAE